MNPLRKCISISGTNWQEGDYRERYVACRNYYNKQGTYRPNYWKDSRATWLKLWVNWNSLQPDPPPSTDFYENAAVLNRGPRIEELDEEIQAANADGIGVILSVFQAYPTWSSGYPTAAPYDYAPNMKGPDDVDHDSPYGRFILWLLARYRYGAPLNTPGPRVGAPIGNPKGAWIMAIEPVNEPNQNMWLDTPDPVWDWTPIAVKAATMMKTARDLSNLIATAAPAIPYRQYVLGPATSDSDRTRPIAGRTIPWEDFTTDVLQALSGWNPDPVYVGWSHHNYQDVRTAAGNTVTRVERLRALLYNGGWKSASPQNKYIWLTEGGYHLGSNYSSQSPGEKYDRQVSQSDRMEYIYGRMVATPDVYMFTQFGMDDKLGDSTKAHLRDDYNFPPPGSSGPGSQGAPRLLFWAWLDNAQMPASTTA